MFRRYAPAIFAAALFCSENSYAQSVSQHAAATLVGRDKIALYFGVDKDLDEKCGLSLDGRRIPVRQQAGAAGFKIDNESALEFDLKTITFFS